MPPLTAEQVIEAVKTGVAAGVQQAGLTKTETPKVEVETEPEDFAEATKFWTARAEHQERELTAHVDKALGFERDDNGARIYAGTRERVPQGAALGRFIWAIAALKRGALHPQVRAALSEGTNSAGGFVVPPQYIAELIPLLRTWSVIRAAGTRVIPLGKSLTQGALSGGATAAYVAENGTISVSTETFAQFTLSVKKLAALVAISNDLMRDANPAIDVIVRDDLVQIMALTQDLQFIRGTGSATAPTGIRNQSGIQTLALGTNGATPGYDNLSDLLALVEQSNAAFISPGWIAHGRFLSTLRKIKDSQNRPILEQANFVFNNPEHVGATGTGGIADTRRPPRWYLLGYPLWITNQLPTNLTKGTSTDCSELYFADFDEAVIGQNMEMTLDTSTEASYSDGGTNNVSAFANDQTLVRAIERHDFGLRHTTPFAVITDARP